MKQRINTISDRIANRVTRHFPGPRVQITNDVPVVTFTLDDAAIDAWQNGAKILENEDVRGTFYISGGLSSDGTGDHVPFDGCRDLYLRGHEIGCHTYEHRKIRSFSRRAFDNDLKRNKALLNELAPNERRRNFAVPFGMTSPLHQPVLRKHFVTSRSIIYGINRGLIDPFHLYAVELRPDTAFITRARQALDDAIHNPGWLIFFTHDISDNPTMFGCYSSVFRSLIVEAKDRGAKIMTVEEAADHYNLL